jgi:hypothetical protein
MKQLVLFLFFSSQCLINIAQTITGKITDKIHNPLSFANAVLINAKDSAFITGTTSNKNGTFSFVKNNSAPCLIRCSAVGYVTTYINCKVGNVGDIIMVESNIALKEVVVTAKTMEQFAEKKTYRFSPNDLKKMTNSLNVMNLIPGLSVMPGNKLVLQAGGNIKILINGINATETDLAVMKPDEVARIDYYDDPPVQYAAMGVSAVVDIITKRKQRGGSVGISLQQVGLTSLFGNNTIGAKYNFNNSQIGFKYTSEVRRANKEINNELLEYTFDGTTYKKEKLGMPSLWELYTHNFSLNYNNRNLDHSMFSAIAGIEYKMNKDDDSQTIVRNSISGFDGQTYSKAKYIMPWVDFYFNRMLDNNKSITVSTTGTYYKTNNKSSYIERSASSILFDSQSNVDGNKYSLTSNATFTMKKGQNNISYGVRDYYSYAAQDILGDEYEHLTSSSNNVYVYGELSGMLGKFYYHGTLGGDYSHFNSSQLNKRYSFFAVRPYVRLNYRPQESTTYFAIYKLSTTNPTLSQLSETPTMLDDKLAFCGNSGLKPYNSQTFSLGYTYNKSRLYYYVYLQYQYSHNPILPYFKLTNDYMLQTYDNLKSSQMYFALANIDYYPFASKWLFFSLCGQILRTESNGSNFSWGYNTIRIIPEMRLTFNKLSFYFHYQTPAKMINGQLLEKSQKSILAEVNYRPGKGMSLGFGICKYYDTGSETHPSALVTRTISKTTRNDQNLVYINFNYNFSIGSVFKETERKFNEKDTDSGILKAY